MSSETPDIPKPRDSFLRLFWRFFKFGMFAWGGPVAQMSMIRHDLVDKREWITKEKFSRAMGVYQALPGPEAMEMCVYFGTIRRGRLGGFLAGLGFMLPGLSLMMLLAWLYARFAPFPPGAKAAMAGCQAAVVALIVRAAFHLGVHAIRNLGLALIASCAFAATLCGLNFMLVLGWSGVVYILVLRNKMTLAGFLTGAAMIATALVATGFFGPPPSAAAPILEGPMPPPGWGTLAASGLRAGLLTFGGAYSVVPFLQHDAVEHGHWLTQAQFLDGIALTGVIPAPLVIMGVFVGYMSAGWTGAWIMAAGIFLPAFAFTLLGHTLIEKSLENRFLHAFLDGLTAGVIGLIGATAFVLCGEVLFKPASWSPQPVASGIFLASLAVLLFFRSKYALPLVVLGAAGAGWLLG